MARSSVLVIAHRGFSGAAPENTLSAFRKAIEIGADMVELDARLSRDGEVVVFHDDTLERTTDGRGRVSDFTFGELRRFDAGSWFSPAYSGERIPSLREVLALTLGKTLINIELKAGGLGGYGKIDLADRSLQVVEELSAADQVLFSSFDLSAVLRISEKDPALPVALITMLPWTLPGDLTRGQPMRVLNCRKTVLNKRNLPKAHELGIKVNVWTVDKEKEMNRFISLGVDGIITNHPDRLIGVLQRMVF